MRKKYLSALLFGALVMASTATFTSCKDYDDDIDNLQEQINSNASAIKALQDKVTAGKWITDLSSVAGGFKVTFSDGQSFTIVNGKDGVNGAAGEAGVAGADGTKVTIGEDGYWYLDGEKTEYKAVADESAQMKAPFLGEDGFLYFYEEGSEEPVKSDIYNTVGVYAVVTGDVVTLYTFDEKGNLVEIVAPTAENALTYVAIDDPGLGEYAVGKGLVWGTATKDVTWKGETVAAGSLLTAALPTSTIFVTPLTYDLAAQALSLVDIDGNEAPIVVTATPAINDEGTTGSRAASVDGKWTLSYEYDETVTAENIATAFTKNNKNLMYALKINGVRMTSYEFVVDTQTAAESKANTKAATIGIADNTNVALDGAELKLNGDDAGKIADWYVTFEGAAKAKAEVLGIVADGQTVTASASAAKALNGSISATVYALDVKGNVVKKTIDLTFKQEVPGQGEILPGVIAKSTLTINNKMEFTVELGSIMADLDAATVYNTKDINLTTENKNFLALSDLTADAHGCYTVKANAVLQKINDEGKAVAIAEGDYNSATQVKITLNQVSGAYLTGATSEDDLYGDFTLYLNLLDEDDAELKKIAIPVKIEAPKFANFFQKNEYAAWDGNTLNVIIDDASDLDVDLNNIFVDADGRPVTMNLIDPTEPEGEEVDDNHISWSYKDANGDNQTGTATSFRGLLDDPTIYTRKFGQLASDANALKQINISSFTVNVGNDGTKVNYDDGAAAKALPLTTSFNVKAVPGFSGAKLVYYVDNVAQDVAVVGADNFIKPLTGAGTSDSKWNGLALVLGNQKIAVGGTASNKLMNGQLGTFTLGDNVVTVLSTTSEKAGAAGKIYTYYETAVGSTGTLSVASDTNDSNKYKLKVADLDVNGGGAIVLYFADENGITTSATIKYKK